MEIEKTNIPDVLVLKPSVHGDERGFFMETYRRDVFTELGLPTDFVQDNHSRSVKNVLRGLHFQWDGPMGKLMRVTRGSAFLVAVDIRKESPTFGKWFGVEVSEENKMQVYAPAGFARGFYTLEDTTEVQYKCTAVYNQKAESGIYWNDPDVGIQWPIKEGTEPIVSDKDKKAQSFAAWSERPESDCFIYSER